MFPGIIVMDSDSMTTEDFNELRAWAEPRGLLLIRKKRGSAFDLHPPTPCPGCPWRPIVDASGKPPGYVA